MIEKDGYPADQYTTRSEVDEPVENCQSAAGQAQEGEEHEGCLHQDADIWYT